MVDDKPQWQVRRYQGFSTAALDGPNDGGSGSSSMGPRAFQTLAGYIFGDNEAEAKMAMTTPVISDSGGDRARMAFVLPSDYWAAPNSAPRPRSNSGVVIEGSPFGTTTLEEAPSSQVGTAVLWFSGYATAETVESKKVHVFI